MPNIPELANVPELNLIDGTLEQKLAEMLDGIRMIAVEQGEDEPDLQKANPYTLFAQALAAGFYHLDVLRERDFRNQLLKYSYGEALDNLAANKAVARQGPKYASCTLRFYASDTLPFAISIPAGTRVRTESDIAFKTEQYAEIAPGQAHVDVHGVAMETGTAANGIPAGLVSKFIDKPPYVKEVENLDTTGGGDDTQSDERLAQDFLHEWTLHNTCGSPEAYEYYVKSFQSDIGTVKAIGPNDEKGNLTGVPAGHVLILFLMQDGSVPEQSLINRIRDKLMGPPIHTMGDFVELRAPDEVEYRIELQYNILMRDANRAGDIQQKVREAVQSYIVLQRRVGACINPDDLLQLVKEAGAHRCPILSPAYTPIPATAIAKLAGEPVITYLGLEAG